MFRLYDSWLGEVTDVVPARPAQLRISACGPQTGRPADLGDLRAALLTDLIRRLSEVRGWSVLACEPVDDLPRRTPGRTRGAPPRADWRDSYLADRAALNIAPPDLAPRASESVGLVIDMISKLIETGHASPGPGGSVSLRPGDAAAGQGGAGQPDAGWPLWRGAPAGSTHTWTGPWGSGFPDALASCPAIWMDCLGARIDIHAEGPGAAREQQEGERSAARAAAGDDAVRHWVRAETVLVDGRFAASADGSGVLLGDVTAHRDPLAIRLALLQHRYREPAGLTTALLDDAAATLRGWQEQVADWADEPSRPISPRYWASITAALDEDLDTPAVLGALAELDADRDVPAGSKFETFAATDRVLALDLVSLVGRAR